ncbi:uncharacterized protein JN550_008403 [Neoarthrinium moseri]|uniref:uncharacterized protein n=1 Tax=Neoarthrinium moseri TaxID=1658444 RepID=UPI001FDD1B87|nr:uncharacterized protein JN550_008403 [Neoarthrinium moseri]KAI1865355.1 hypothetical protein JN550_008403 [Neoarthrinium moseri]
MHWSTLFIAALAAPVLSHSHGHNHKHRRRACSGAKPTVATYAAAAVETVQTAPVVEAVQSASPATEAVQSSAPVVETVQSASPVVEDVKAAPVVEAVQSASPLVAAVQKAEEVTQVTGTIIPAVSETTQSAAPAVQTPGRATWLWQSNLIQDSAQVDDFLSFADSNDIMTVYALIDRGMGNEVFYDFVARCNASGIVVEALMGNSQWILGQGEPTFQSQLDWLEQYQGSADASSKFAGIHIDVEPWGLDGWTSNKETYVASFQSIITQLKSLGSSLGLPVAADLPYWADKIICPDTGKGLDVWALENLDTATFMTYRNTAEELLEVATAVLEAGNAAGKPVWLAVETVAAAEAYLISYVGKSSANLFTDLTTIKTTAAKYTSFAGIAIHDYDGVKALSS